MTLSIKHLDSKFKNKNKPKVGLIALSTDQTIESDFNKICNNLPLNIFINRIHNQNPLTKENLLKMQDDLESVTHKILPDETDKNWSYILDPANEESIKSKAASTPSTFKDKMLGGHGIIEEVYIALGPYYDVSEYDKSFPGVIEKVNDVQNYALASTIAPDVTRSSEQAAARRMYTDVNPDIEDQKIPHGTSWSTVSSYLVSFFTRMLRSYNRNIKNQVRVKRPMGTAARIEELQLECEAIMNQIVNHQSSAGMDHVSIYELTQEYEAKLIQIQSLGGFTKKQSAALDFRNESVRMTKKILLEFLRSPEAVTVAGIESFLSLVFDLLNDDLEATGGERAIDYFETLRDCLAEIETTISGGTVDNVIQFPAPMGGEPLTMDALNTNSDLKVTAESKIYEKILLSILNSK